MSGFSRTAEQVQADTEAWVAAGDAFLNIKRPECRRAKGTGEFRSKCRKKARTP